MQRKALENALHVTPSPGVMLCMKKVLFASLLVAGATVLLLAQQSRPVAGTAPGRIATGGSSQSPIYAPYELLSVFPQSNADGEYQQVDPAQLQSLSDQGWQLVCVSPYVYRNEGHDAGTSATAPPPPLVTQVYLAYFFQRARLMH